MKPQWGIVTDEITEDPQKAMEIASDWGLKSVEIRGVGLNRRVPDLETEQIKGIADQAKRLNLEITALSPGTLKCSLHDEEAAGQMKRFEKTLELAQIFCVKRVITFSVKRSPLDDASAEQQVLDLLGEMNLKAKRCGITLCVENERGWWADTKEALMFLMSKLAPAGLRLNFDAANLVDAGDVADQKTWSELYPFISSMHLKDICIQGSSKRWCLLGEGQVGWPALLPVILSSDRQIPMNIETHCPPLLENSYRNRCFLKQFEEDVL